MVTPLLGYKLVVESNTKPYKKKIFVYFPENKTTKKSKRNTGDIRKSIPIQIEKLKQSIARKNQVNVKKNAKLLLKKDRANQGKSSVDVSSLSFANIHIR